MVRPDLSPQLFRPRGTAAFTLIEVIGVLAIMAILAAMLVPRVIDRIRDSRRTKEQSDLAVMAEALTNQIVVSQSIPNHTTWFTVIANELEQPVSSITNVAGNSRAFVIDTNLAIGGAGLPYTQGTSLATNVSSARVMIVSSIGTALPISSGILSSSAFNNIWTNAYRSIPVGWSWSGNPEDLFIQRINLEPLFYRIVLNNMDVSVTPKFRFNTAITNDIPSTNLTGYALGGSVLTLYDNTGLEDTRHILTKNASYFFERGIWRSQFIEGKQRSGVISNYTSTAVDFSNLPDNPTAAAGGEVQAVVDIFNLFLTAWYQWSVDPYETVERERTVTGLQQRLEKVTEDLIQ